MQDQPWALAPVECVDGGEGWSGTYDAGANKAWVNAHYEYPTASWYRDAGAHEEGHAWAVQRLGWSPEQVARYAQIRGGPEPAHGWFEDHGDVFMYATGGSQPGYGTPRPPAAQLDQLRVEGFVP